MSKQLEQIEELASPEQFKEPERIAWVLEEFLKMSYRELAGEKYVYGIIAREFQRSFHLQQERIFDQPISDYLTLVGYIPENTYYNFSEEDDWFFQSDGIGQRFTAAPTCFSLAWLLLKREMEVWQVGLLFHVNFRALIDFFMQKAPHRTETIGLCYSDAAWFLREYGHHEEIDVLSLGDVIDQIILTATKFWSCGGVTLRNYVTQIVKAYQLLEELLLDCLSETLLPTGRDQLSRIVTNCIEPGIDPEIILEDISPDYGDL
ncbi:MAG: hypothetical protein K6G23_07255 [Lachnospiraceae bacterium]|nr:hypothetical protein [Lachnospiraceae bacterium]